MSKFKRIRYYPVAFLFLLGMFYYGFKFDINHSLFLSFMDVLIIDMIYMTWFWRDDDE